MRFAVSCGLGLASHHWRQLTSNVRPQKPLKFLALASIKAYQRWISPHKGFACAYRIHTGCSSCSELGYRAIRRHGLFSGLAILKARTYRCGVAHRRYHVPRQRTRTGQRGDCDLGCDAPGECSCDLPGGSNAAQWFRVLECCDCGGSSKKERDEREKYVHIPPDVRA